MSAPPAAELNELNLSLESTEHTPARQRWFYGWAMLPLSMAALVASSPGQTFGISVFNEPMRESLGLSHSLLAFAYMLGTLLAAIPIAYIGNLMDRHGLRRMMLLVVTLFSAACLATSLVNNWLMLFGAFFLLRMLGPGALAFVSSNTLAYWFDRRLGTVEGLRQLGMAAAMGFIPALNLWLVNRYGWRGAYAVFGVAIWVLLFPTFWLFFRNRPEDTGQRIDGHCADELDLESSTSPLPIEVGLTLEQTLRTPAFWAVTAGTTLFSLIHTAVFFCLVPIIRERGLSEHDATAMLTVFAGCLAVTQLVGGILADRLAARRLLALGQAGLSLSMLLLVSANSSAGAQVAGALMGISQGLFFGTAHPLWARYFGRLHLGKIRGLLMTLNVGCSSLGPLFAGVMRDTLGDFHIALVVFAILPLPIALLSLRAHRPTATAEAATR